jgi:hypothetical protein
MEDTLQLQDLVDFDELFTEMKQKVYEKNAKRKSYSEDLLALFQTLYNTIEKTCTRVGLKTSVVA